MYPFRSVPLTSGVAAQLIPQIYGAGATVSRATIINEIVDYHTERGGLPPRGSVTSLVKKGLSDLLKNERVEQVTVGFYRIGHSTATTEGADVPAEEEQPIEYGEGPETVYVYYFPAYKDQAAYLGNETWPVKVGQTTGEAPYRVRDQIGTAMPELPLVGLSYRCADSKAMEKAIHATLTNRGKRMLDAPGKEWFNTSLVEIQEIIDFVG